MTDLVATLTLLRATPTATITDALKKHGLTRVWMNGPRALAPGQARIAGPAFTLRFIPVREDISVDRAILGPTSIRAALPKIAPGSVLVVDAMGSPMAGAVGDILSLRMQQSGIAGLVTDGAVRDLSAIRALGWPVWASGGAAPSSNVAFFCAGHQEAVACGGVAVFAGDIVVADEDGAVVVPAAIAGEIARQAAETERFEEWVAVQVRGGAAIAGLYPPDAATRARYQAETAG